MNPGSLLVATLHEEAPAWHGQLASAWSAPPQGINDLIHHEGAALWLQRRLTELGLLDRLPALTRQRLREQVLVHAGLNLRVDEAARQVFQHLATGGYPCIALKGVGRRALASRWPGLDARPVSDVDLLLPPDAVDEAWRYLRAQGYRLTDPGAEARYRTHHHLACLLGPAGVSIELHRSTTTVLAAEEAWSRFRGDAELVGWQGQQVLVPSPTELVWHALSHSSTDGVAGFRLRRWLDVVVLVRAGAVVNWEVIAQRLQEEVVLDDQEAKPLNPRILRQWLGGAAALMSVPTAAGWRHLGLPLALERLLNGRARLLGSRLGRSGAGRRLMVEWSRGALGWPLEQSAGTGWDRARAAAAGVVARAAGRLLNLGGGGQRPLVMARGDA